MGPFMSTLFYVGLTAAGARMLWVAIRPSLAMRRIRRQLPILASEARVNWKQLANWGQYKRPRGL
jgi:hypothetical protein